MKRLLIPLLIIACNSNAAGIQKWVDQDGNVHYGDTPPAKTKTQSINVTRPPSNPGRPLPRFSATDDDKKKAEATEADLKKQQDKSTKEADVEICKKAKSDLDVIARSNTIRLRLNDGTERVLSEKEIDERKIQVEENIKRYCK